MNEVRAYHGLAVALVNNEPTLLAFGGSYYQNGDSIEIWNPDDETWTLANDMKLRETKNAFGFLSIPLHLLCNWMLFPKNEQSSIKKI